MVSLGGGHLSHQSGQIPRCAGSRRRHPLSVDRWPLRLAGMQSRRATMSAEAARSLRIGMRSPGSRFGCQHSRHCEAMKQVIHVGGRLTPLCGRTRAPATRLRSHSTLYRGGQKGCSRNGAIRDLVLFGSPRRTRPEKPVPGRERRFSVHRQHALEPPRPADKGERGGSSGAGRLESGTPRSRSTWMHGTCSLRQGFPPFTPLTLRS